MYSYGAQHVAEQKQDDQLEYTYSSYVRIRHVALETCQRRWTIGRSGERGSGISVLAARHDDDDDPNQHYCYVNSLPISHSKNVLFPLHLVVDIHCTFTTDFLVGLAFVVLNNPFFLLIVPMLCYVPQIDAWATTVLTCL